MIRQADFNQGLYYLNGTTVIEKTNFVPNTVLNCAKCDIDTWHYRCKTHLLYYLYFKGLPQISWA